MEKRATIERQRGQVNAACEGARPYLKISLRLKPCGARGSHRTARYCQTLRMGFFADESSVPAGRA